jgi:hypothetical protein
MECPDHSDTLGVGNLRATSDFDPDYQRRSSRYRSKESPVTLSKAST